jgi:hypothetical protein
MLVKNAAAFARTVISCAAIAWTAGLLLLACSSTQSRDGGAVIPDAPAEGRDAASEVASDAATAADEPSLPSPDLAAAEVPIPDAPTADVRIGPDSADLRVGVDSQPTCSGICNAVTPSYPTVTADSGQGNVTRYSSGPSKGGACNYGVTNVLYYVAVNVNVVPGDGLGQWQGGRACGQCVEVTALTSQGPRSVVVRIMDKCADGYCGMDLGGVAPEAIMADGSGRYDGSWRFVSCTGHPEVSDGPPSLSVSTGANSHWSRVQIRNPPAAVASIAWRDSQGGAGAFPYASDPENTFEVPASVLQSTVATITVTATFRDGSSLSVDLSPAQLGKENTTYVMN